MKILSVLFLSLMIFEAQASCLGHWKSTAGLARKRLNPLAQQDPSRMGSPGTDDQFVDLGESVSGIIERSALIPKVLFQERVIRFMEKKQTARDLEAMGTEFSKRFPYPGQKLFTQKLNRLFKSPENLCRSEEEVELDHTPPFESPDYVLGENEVYDRLNSF